MSKEKGFSNAEILWFDLVGHFTHVLSQPHDLLFAALKPGEASKKLWSSSI